MRNSEKNKIERESERRAGYGMAKAISTREKQIGVGIEAMRKVKSEEQRNEDTNTQHFKIILCSTLSVSLSISFNFLSIKLSGHISHSKEIKKIVCIKWRFLRLSSFIFRVIIHTFFFVDSMYIYIFLYCALATSIPFLTA